MKRILSFFSYTSFGFGVVMIFTGHYLVGLLAIVASGIIQAESEGVKP